MTRFDSFLDAVNDRRPVKTEVLVGLELSENGVKKMGEFLLARGYQTKRGSHWLTCD